MVMWTNTHCFDFFLCNLIYIVSICAKLQTSSASPSTVVPVMNGHPRDQAKVSVHCRWPLVTGTDGQAGRQI